jgi:hypothetical protein
MRKLVSLVVAAAFMALAITSVASAATTVPYTGQGFTNGSLNTSQCGPDPAPDSTSPYLLWVLTANGATSATITGPWGTANMTDNGQWKYVSGYYTPDQLTNVSASFEGTTNGNPQLVVSHGCAGIPAVDSHTATEIHLAGGHTAVSGAQPLGTSVHDSATVTTDNDINGNPVAIPAGSTVKFTFYNGVDGDSCGGSAIGSSNDLDATSGSVDPALPEGPLGAGDYGYKAVFTSGDTSKVKNSTGPCEPLHINKAQLAITTDIHNASHSIVTKVLVNTSVHDTATVTGAVSGFPIEAVSFTLNGNPVANGAGADGTTTAHSMDSGPLAVGNYTYKASVADNANYIGATSADEPLEVTNAAWCSPGYWRNADDAAWSLAGANKTDKFNTTVYNGFYGATFAVNPSLFNVLSASGGTYKGAGVAGTLGYPAMNAFNATGAYLTSKIPGYTFNGNTSVDFCPIDAHGVFKP